MVKWLGEGAGVYFRAGGLEDFLEHGLGELAGEGVLLGGVVGTEEEGWDFGALIFDF